MKKVIIVTVILIAVTSIGWTTKVTPMVPFTSLLGVLAGVAIGRVLRSKI